MTIGDERYNVIFHESGSFSVFHDVFSGMHTTKEHVAETRVNHLKEIIQNKISSTNSDLPHILNTDNAISSISSTPEKIEQIRQLCHKISERTKLSTTGYQTAMVRIKHNADQDSKFKMTYSRAMQYTNEAKERYPVSTLKELAILQGDYINKTNSDKLLGPVEMSPEELTECLKKCRKTGFSNCDIQALEVAMHLRYQLGITDFEIISNHKISHNYVILKPSSDFPKGAIVDTWTGRDLQDFSFKNKLKFQHREGNFQINHNMHEWVEKYGSQYIMI